MSRVEVGRPLRIVLVGEESAGIKALKAVEASGSQIVAVMASPPKTGEGRGGLWEFAENLGYAPWPAILVKDPAFADRLRSENVDLLLNLHSLYLIHSKVLSAVRIGAFNMHPGPLPAYAGLNTVSWALYRGERNYGVTVHRMVPEIDAGEIAYQAFFPIEECDTPVSLTHKCIEAGIPLLVQLLGDASASPVKIPAVQQDGHARKYFGKEVPQGGHLCWSRPADEIVNFVRACDYFPYRSPWGHPKSFLNGLEIEIHSALRTGEPCPEQSGVVGPHAESGVSVASADEWVCVKRLSIGNKRVDPRTVLQPGQRFEPSGKGWE